MGMVKFVRTYLHFCNDSLALRYDGDSMMRLLLLTAVLWGSVVAADTGSKLPQGIYTNEEEVYFDKEARKDAAPWAGIRVGDDGIWNEVDVFGDDNYGKNWNVETVATLAPDRLTATLESGRTTVMRRARAVTCWGSVPKRTKKPDGSEDWYFAAGLKLHDQGGRVAFGGGDTGAPPVVLRIRNVVWPSGPNKPSLVLYIHKPETPDRAESYSWADPEAKRIGINLRWMQASCTVD